MGDRTRSKAIPRRERPNAQATLLESLDSLRPPSCRLDGRRPRRHPICRHLHHKEEGTAAQPPAPLRGPPNGYGSLPEHKKSPQSADLQCSWQSLQRELTGGRFCHAPPHMEGSASRNSRRQIYLNSSTARRAHVGDATGRCFGCSLARWPPSELLGIGRKNPATAQASSSRASHSGVSRGSLMGNSSILANPLYTLRSSALGCQHLLYDG